MRLKVGELARATHTTAPTIRYYENISILKFDGPGPAQGNASSIWNNQQVEEVLLVFGSTVTEQQEAAFEQAVMHAVI